jgi:hypothetical protein
MLIPPPSARSAAAGVLGAGVLAGAMLFGVAQRGFAELVNGPAKADCGRVRRDWSQRAAERCGRRLQVLVGRIYPRGGRRWSTRA